MEKYRTYNKCIVRTPLYPVNFIDRLDNYDSSIFLQSFKEAVYISSPVLYNELFVKKNATNKTTKSAIKFFLRSCTRSTPYGAFAGCDIIQVNPMDESIIIMSGIDHNKTFSRIDMNYLCEYIRLLEAQPEIRNSIAYHLNTSSYFISNNLRYIEYKFDKIRRKYFFSEIICPSYLTKVLKELKKQPLRISQIEALLIKETGASDNEAREFINELINEQILVSNLEPSVVGEDLIYQLKNKLNAININTSFIDSIINFLSNCDASELGKKEESLNRIYDLLSSSHIGKEGAFIHVDTLNKTEKGVIGHNIINAINKCLYLFSKFPIRENQDFFSGFRKKFYDKYEEQEIPLVVALDPQVGLGYGKWTEQNGDINQLLQGLPTPSQSESDSGFKFNPASALILQKYEESLKTGSKEIQITDEDLKAFKDSDLSMSQCCALFSVLSNDENPTILLKGLYGGVSSRLLSRFEYLERDIEKLVNEINDHDVDIYGDKIVAEVAHLPEDRIGNIQMHPNNRKYTICYLSNPSEAHGGTIIPVDDIMISIPRGQRIVLRSKKYNKEIIPMLSTAHNYMSGLPIYSFLSDYINQEAHYYYFEWNPFFNQKPFLPRISYHNIILMPARWLVGMNLFPEGVDSERILKYKNEVGLPDEVLLTVGDNKLYINFNKEYSLDLLCEELTKKKVITLEEFLYSSSNKNLVCSKDGSYYTNEIILNLFREQ
ncbi:MAG: lantibiotic dehydratase family protein [Bacteroidales bacterium]|nr:lantibiotic dehydratase family protein [Bacteroidales bacterium]